MILRRSNLLFVQLGIDRCYEDDQDAPEKGEGGLKSAGKVGGGEWSFKQGHKGDKVEERGGGGCF